MELIKMGNKYLVKNSNGKIIDEKERLELEKKDLVIKDIVGNECQEKTTKKIKKINKKLKEINDSEVINDPIEETELTD